MELWCALIFYIVILIILTLIFYYAAELRLVSAFIISIVFALIILVFTYSPLKLITEDHSWMIAAYLLLILLSIIVIIIYVFSCGLVDKRCCSYTCDDDV